MNSSGAGVTQNSTMKISAHSSGDDMPLLVIENVKKSFGAVQALKGISFTIDRGEVVALVGDNGAGKSTLAKVLSGVYQADSGRFFLDGYLCHFSRPAEARAAGVETVYQDLALIEQLDVAENVFLGKEHIYGGVFGRLIGWLDRNRMRRETSTALDQLHIKIPAPTSPVRRMSGGQRQCIAIGRALIWGRKLLIMDEPVAALGVDETEQVLTMIEKLRDTQGFGFLAISHNMEHVYRIADKIVVLRQGEYRVTLRKEETTMQEIVAYITGAK
ncbi:MAG: ATP-binding cassette domain-containing protein [Thermodesulfobacteriota bacterium]